jgi:hypothetical protein
MHTLLPHPGNGPRCNNTGIHQCRYDILRDHDIVIDQSNVSGTGDLYTSVPPSLYVDWTLIPDIPATLDVRAGLLTNRMYENRPLRRENGYQVSQ